MLKVIFYALITFISASFFSSCIADRRGSTGNSQTNNVKSEAKQKTENKENDSSKSSTEKDSEKSEMRNESSDDEPEITENEDGKTTGGKPELRCGWFINPTPGNHWLDDKDGEWTIGVQGGFQAEGDYPPEFSDSQWVKTNGYYGYGCACLRVVVDRKEQRILKVISGNARPLSACRNDPALTEPPE